MIILQLGSEEGLILRHLALNGNHIFYYEKVKFSLGDQEIMQGLFLFEMESSVLCLIFAFCSFIHSFIYLSLSFNQQVNKLFKRIPVLYNVNYVVNKN